jgi:hypothetical protein
MWLPDAIIGDVEDRVTVFYVTYAATRYWAENRDKGEPLVFSGWYWAQGPVEGGPFKSRSACYRDAWFRVVQKRTPPVLRGQLNKAEKEMQQRVKTKTRAKAKTKMTKTSSTVVALRVARQAA